ncbi:hypothetical protein DPMN_121531 [Dreissena polymorpha]|uniref:Uncharacterized protein n=1 Tax=Dreissena polymorpha TaxID=45954 RepID=A0A9D4JTM5_DREPO|nr:hypothetical protein DPMN_121531 [Dreissena polymorpha]
MSSPPGGHVFQQTATICVHIQDIIKTNILTKFHEDQTINVTKSVNKTNAPPPALIQDIIGTNLLIKFHDDRTINMASGKNDLPPRGHVFQETGTIFHDHLTINVASRENAPPSDIICTNILTKFYEDRTKNVANRLKNSLPFGGNVFQATGTIFELVQYIIGTNLLTRFYDDRTMHVASRVYTGKNAPPPGGTVFQPTRTIFSRLLTRQMLTLYNARWTKGDHKSVPLYSGEL